MGNESVPTDNNQPTDPPAQWEYYALDPNHPSNGKALTRQEFRDIRRRSREQDEQQATQKQELREQADVSCDYRARHLITAAGIAKVQNRKPSQQDEASAMAITPYWRTLTQTLGKESMSLRINYVLQKTFLRMHYKYGHIQQSGSCAMVLLRVGQQVFTAYVGDSVAFRVKQNTGEGQPPPPADCLNTKFHSKPINNRHGILQVDRAFGDAEMFEGSSQTHYIPDIDVVDHEKGDVYVLGSDGLYGNHENNIDENYRKKFSSVLQKHKNLSPDETAVKIINGIRKSTHDNITVVVSKDLQDGNAMAVFDGHGRTGVVARSLNNDLLPTLNKELCIIFTIEQLKTRVLYRENKKFREAIDKFEKLYFHCKELFETAQDHEIERADKINEFCFDLATMLRQEFFPHQTANIADATGNANSIAPPGSTNRKINFPDLSNRLKEKYSDQYQTNFDSHRDGGTKKYGLWAIDGLLAILTGIGIIAELVSIALTGQGIVTYLNRKTNSAKLATGVTKDLSKIKSAEESDINESGEENGENHQTVPGQH